MPEITSPESDEREQQEGHRMDKKCNASNAAAIKGHPSIAISN
jgi:hypothetical protein